MKEQFDFHRKDELEENEVEESAMQSDHRNFGLERALSVFRENQDEFASNHHGQFVVIHENEVVGFFDDELEAYHEAKTRYGLGAFLLRQCLRPDEEDEPVFHSRVA